MRVREMKTRPSEMKDERRHARNESLGDEAR